MTFLKLGELVELTPSSVQSVESVLSDAQINEQFKKFADSLRRIAPKANDFLYFSAVMMHAAEAVLVDSSGSLKKTSMGEPLHAHWDISKNGSWKWICNDSSIKPFKNNNGDIFPEQELLKAYKNWIGKPLCTDHRSNSVDAIRGVILDTYYDRPLKRVIALCALDKVSYPELARKVATGYSTSVSMGTGVLTAICFDCGNVARTESDFCNHMRTKSCYGEINVGLQPIELSIVVNGADPQAKIRTIIAAANTINDRLASVETEITKLSDSEQSAKVKELQDVLKSANDKLSELQDLINTGENTVEPPYGQSSGRLEDPQDATDPNAQNMNIPVRYAYNEALIGELKNLHASIEARLSTIETVLSSGYNKQEDKMSDSSLNKEGFFQGGGGVNEPTPGKAKYPKDPLQEHLREKEDKQMVGQSPFPEVGDVKGLHPSPESAEQSNELERKKMMLRAERRATALQKAKENIMNLKEAYWQGGGGVNEPAPGKVKYPIDPTEGKDRKNEDKQMVGQKPFPDVGDVNGLHPSPLSADEKDELERKKLHQRASYVAKFHRVANLDGTDNLSESAWNVYAKTDEGNKLVFTATVNEITGGRSEALFDVVATKEFGTKMLEKIRSVGFEKAATLYKKAQAVTQPGTQLAAPPDAGGAGQVPAMPDMGVPALDAAPPPANDNAQDKGGDGDPKESALKLAEQARDITSDLLEKVRELTGEQTEMGDLEKGLDTLPKAASQALAPLAKMRKELNAALVSGMKKSVAELKEHCEELELVASVLDNKDVANKEYVDTVIADALTDAKKAIADAFALKQAYAKYLRGTAGLLKKAEEAEDTMLTSLATDDENDARAKAKNKSKSKSTEKSSDCSDMSYADDSAALDANDTNFDMELGSDLGSDPEMGDDFGSDHDLGGDEGDDLSHEDGDESLFAGLGDTDEDENAHMDTSEDAGHTVGHDTNDVMMDVDPTSLEGKKVEIKNASFDLTTKEGRAAYRAKLARDATGKEDSGEEISAEKMPHSDMLDEANRLADGQTKLDTKPSDDLGYVETLPEAHKQMLEVARMPPKVKKEAERLNQFIVEGKVDVKDLDALIAQGLDPEVVKYWRQYWGEAGKEGSEFGKLLTTETFKAKQAEEMATYKVKVARAYELVNDMVKRGLCTDDRTAVAAQVDEVMKWNDEAFESMKRVVAKHQPTKLQKEASLPNVGLIGTGDQYASAPLDLQGELDRAFAGRKY